jgi:hypothetical protein
MYVHVLFADRECFAAVARGPRARGRCPVASSRGRSGLSWLVFDLSKICLIFA